MVDDGNVPVVRKLALVVLRAIEEVSLLHECKLHDVIVLST